MSHPCSLEFSGFDFDLVVSPLLIVGFTPVSLALALEEHLVVLSPPGDS